MLLGHSFALLGIGRSLQLMPRRAPGKEIHVERENASTVAVIDDDSDVREVLGVLLETAGYSVQTYESGAQYLADPDHHQMACIVVDQRMPDMTGLELLLELERRGVTIPALLITGVEDADIVRKANNLGAMTVMQKPVSSHMLLQFIAFSTGLAPTATDEGP
jgi:FixJ family two-component response regulator